MKKYIIPFKNINAEDIAKVGEKNASVGELINHLSPLGIHAPDGFAITAKAYFDFLDFNSLFPQLQTELSSINRITFENTADVCARCRDLVMRSVFTEQIQHEIKSAYSELVSKHGLNASVAVRSSGTINNQLIPGFDGQYDTCLNVNGCKEVLHAVKKCYASLFNENALRYRADECCGDLLSGISIGVQLMVRSDKGSSGIALTVDVSSENSEVIYVTGSWGLGRGESHHKVNADEFYLSKTALRKGNPSVMLNVRGLKEKMLVFGTHEQTKWVKTPVDQQQKEILSNSELELLGLWCLAIEKYYQHPVEIEWAKDGENEKLYVLQARVERNPKKNHLADKPIPPDIKGAFKTFIATGSISDDIPSLHRESLDWLKQIEFMRDEVVFLQKLLVNILHISIAKPSSAKISEELSYLSEHSIALLHHKIIDHERWLADTIQTDTPGRQISYREIHAELKEELMKYYRVFLQLRRSIFFITKEYYQNQVKAKLQ